MMSKLGNAGGTGIVVHSQDTYVKSESSRNLLQQSSALPNQYSVSETVRQQRVGNK